MQSSVQSLSHVQLFATPWIAARQASLSITNSRSSLRLTSFESVMPSSHLILCRPLLLCQAGWSRSWNQDFRRNINHLRYADNTTLMAEREEELKSLLMKVKQESEKASLKFNSQLSNIMAPGPITSWQIDGETMETRTGFFSWSLKSLQMVIIAIK